MTRLDDALMALQSALNGPLSDDELAEGVRAAREILALKSPLRGQPVDNVLWVPIDRVKPNDYNPNSVAKVEMGLLYTSIKHDGYTQPIVTVYDRLTDSYVIVDGFHRFFTAQNNPDILERNRGCVPIVVIDKPMNDRMASTVRHNRARGRHSVDGMTNMTYRMKDEGWSDEEICNQLGMEPEELTRLLHINGFAKQFEGIEFKKRWETKRQIRVRQEAKARELEGHDSPA